MFYDVKNTFIRQVSNTFNTSYKDHHVEDSDDSRNRWSLSKDKFVHKINKCKLVVASTVLPVFIPPCLWLYLQTHKHTFYFDFIFTVLWYRYDKHTRTRKSKIFQLPVFKDQITHVRKSMFKSGNLFIEPILFKLCFFQEYCYKSCLSCPQSAMIIRWYKCMFTSSAIHLNHT